MRYEEIRKEHGVHSADVAAVWPVAGQIAPVPIPDMETPAPVHQPAAAADDVPGVVGAMIAASYAAVVATLFLATSGSVYSIFMITVSALFVLIFFTVPRIFMAIEPKSKTRATFDHFLENGMETLTGHSSAKAAMVQMMIVPVFLTFGIGAMGIAAAMIM